MDTQRCGRCKEWLPWDEYCPSYRGKPGTWCKPCFRAYARDRKTSVAVSHEARLCAYCGSSYVPKQLKSDAAFCSRRCKDEAAARRKQAAIDAAKPRRECLHCAAHLPKEMRADAVFCSEECNSRAHSLQRKLRMRTGQDNKPGYLRAVICGRDKWTCGICKKRVSPSAEYPNPQCASLDHVIPVSQGGLSEPVNLRLVHLVCNLRRRNLGGVEQLAMFG